MGLYRTLGYRGRIDCDSILQIGSLTTCIAANSAATRFTCFWDRSSWLSHCIIITLNNINAVTSDKWRQMPTTSNRRRITSKCCRITSKCYRIVSMTTTSLLASLLSTNSARRMTPDELSHLTRRCRHSMNILRRKMRTSGPVTSHWLRHGGCSSWGQTRRMKRLLIVTSRHLRHLDQVGWQCLVVIWLGLLSDCCCQRNSILWTCFHY